jgi:hypothetical protein
VNAPRPNRNPLLPALIGVLVAAYFDIRFYFIDHQHFALGSAVVVFTAAFVILFLMRSRFAWLAAVILWFVIGLTLLLTYQLGYMGFPFTWFVGFVDLVIFALMLRWLWRIRQPYLRYVAPEQV